MHDCYERPENCEWQPSVSSEADAEPLRVLHILSLPDTVIVWAGDEMTKPQRGQGLDCWCHVENEPGDQLD